MSQADLSTYYNDWRNYIDIKYDRVMLIYHIITNGEIRNIIVLLLLNL